LTSGVNKGFHTRKAEPKDLEVIKTIADEHRDELGFILRPALAESIRREEVIVSENGSGIIGFVEYHHRRDEQTTLYHIAVASDYRRRGIGRSLVSALREEARAFDKRVIRLKCPVDLPAQDFYARMGFQIEGEVEGKARRLVLWALHVR
jgi:ribosomal protein S18 acetylase RimI-like enzyme